MSTTQAVPDETGLGGASALQVGASQCLGGGGLRFSLWNLCVYRT
jgi:hypothetical protein